MQTEKLKSRKLLLVTFPVDLGSITWEKLLTAAFADHVDLKVYRFTSNQYRKVHHKKLLKERFLCSIGLWKEIFKAQLEGRKILFQGISPALYAYPSNIRRNSYIILDWTRKLYEPLHGTLPSPAWLTFTHSLVLGSQKRILGVTNTVIDGMIRDYKIPSQKIKKANFPFSSDLDLFVPSPKREDQDIRILFVGGDIYRKGGDVLLQWFLQQNNPAIKLTMITRSQIEAHPGIEVKNNIAFGQAEHIKTFMNHDLFVLPTKCDAYPTVLGEAACAGLAILTTKNAMGAPEIIKNGKNGYICESQAALLEKLGEVIKDKTTIEIMKVESRKHMEREFNSEAVIQQLIQCIFED